MRFVRSRDVKIEGGPMGDSNKRILLVDDESSIT